MAGKIQNEDIKSAAELVAGGSDASHLPNDDKVYVTANTLNKSLKQAIIDGDIGGAYYVWSVITSNTTMVSGHGYIANNASVLTLTLPTTAAVGDRFAIAGLGAGGWKIGQNAGQQVIRDTLSTGVGVGNGLQSSAQYSCVQVICVVANTTFVVVNSQGATNAFTALMGFIVGGINSSGTTIATIDQFNFAADTASTTGTSLGAATSDSAGCSNASTAGYSLGGTSGGNGVNTIRKVDFSTFATSSIGATISTQVRNCVNSGTQNSTTGWAFGGENNSAIRQTVIQKLTFSGESTSTATGSLGAGRTATTAVTSSTKGYSMGGNNSGATAQTTVYALTYSGEAVATVGNSLTQATDTMSGVYSSTKGYGIGGDLTSNNSTTTTQALTFSGETIAALSAVLGTAIEASAQMTNTGIAGYAAGGNTNQSTAGKNVIQKLTFSGETTSTPVSTLTVASKYVTGMHMS